MKQIILILGADGMVGHKLFQELSKQQSLDVFGSLRQAKPDQKFVKYFGVELLSKITCNIDANHLSSIAALLKKLKPDVLINCIGITKQAIDEKNPLEAIETNAAFPHRLAALCKTTKTRMIQLATDCVFNGAKGNYKESDQSDATDLYGRTKFLGEVDHPNCLTIRTSFIGHELNTNHGLVEWFQAQKGQAKGFTGAIYSGMPTVLIAEVLTKYILTNPSLQGLYQISTKPISKYELLHLIAKVYARKIKITPDDSAKTNRSLNSDRFRQKTGFKPMSWPQMIDIMFADYESNKYKKPSREDHNVA